MGDRDPARARTLVREAGVEKLSFEALGWLLPVLLGSDADSLADVAAIRRHLDNRATETAATAHFAVSYRRRRVPAAALGPPRRRRAPRGADRRIQPKSDLIPKLVAGLLGHRKAGRWENTQENAFVLLALDRYFATYEKTTPDFVARLWLGEAFAGEQAFRGRTTERHHVDIPMARAGSAGTAGRTSSSPRTAPAGSTTASGCATRRQGLRLDAGRPRLHGRARVRGRRRPGRRAPRSRRHLASPRRGAGARARDDGGRGAALPRGARRSAACRPRGPEPGARHDRPAACTRSGRRLRRREAAPARLLVVARVPGSSTRTCATSASRPSPRCSGKASTRTRIPRARLRRARSSCPRPTPRRCTTPRRSAAEARQRL